MTTILRKPRLMGALASTAIAIALIPFSAPTRATLVTPTQRAVFDRMDYALANPNNVGIEGTAITSDGDILLAAEAQQSRVRISNMTDGTTISLVTVEIAPRAMVINSNDTLAYVANVSSDSISVIDMSDYSVTTPITDVCDSGAMSNIALNPLDTYIVATCSGPWTGVGTEIHIIRLSDQSETTVTPTEPAVRIAMHPDGNSFFVASKWGTADLTNANIISQYSMPAGTLITTIDTGDTGTDGITNIALNGDGSIIYVVKDVKNIQAWTNLGTTPSKLWQTTINTDGTRDVGGPSPLVVDNSRNTGYFVTANKRWPNSFEMIDLSDGTYLGEIWTDETWAPSAILSPDGTELIISGRRHSNIHIWTVAEQATTTTESTTTTTLEETTTTVEDSTTSTTEDPTDTTDDADTTDDSEEEAISGGSSTSSTESVDAVMAESGSHSSRNLYLALMMLILGAGLAYSARLKPTGE